VNVVLTQGKTETYTCDFGLPRCIQLIVCTKEYVISIKEDRKIVHFDLPTEVLFKYHPIANEVYGTQNGKGQGTAHQLSRPLFNGIRIPRISLLIV
jgi:hypothetical protein